MSKKNIVIAVVLSVLILLVVGLTKIFTFESNYEWKKSSSHAIPAPVLDMVSQLEKNNLNADLIILDSSFNKIVTIETINSKSILRPYWYYKLKVKGQDLILRKIAVAPPFIIYDKNAYVQSRSTLNSDSVVSKQFLVADLRSIK